MNDEDDEDVPDGYQDFQTLFQAQLEAASRGNDCPMPPMDFDAQLKTLSERLSSVAALIEQHRREMQPSGMPDLMLDMTTWNLYQTAFHLAVRDL